MSDAGMDDGAFERFRAMTEAQDDSARASGRLFGRYSDEQMRALFDLRQKQAEKLLEAVKPYLITEKFKAQQTKERP